MDHSFNVKRVSCTRTAVFSQPFVIEQALCWVGLPPWAGNPGCRRLVFTVREGPGTLPMRLAGEYQGGVTLGHSETARKNLNPALVVA